MALSKESTYCVHIFGVYTIVLINHFILVLLIFLTGSMTEWSNEKVTDRAIESR